MTTVREALELAMAGHSLDEAQIRDVFDQILDGGAPPSLVAGLLVALRIKGESPQELAGGVRALLARARPLDLNGGELLDTAGTGGDGKGTFNISTAAALIAAAAGVRVAKSGNRAASGIVGAADVLERFGVRIELDPPGLKRCLARAGICFVFAPYYHPAVARVVPLRKELGIRTLFNLLGPIANAARPARKLVGVAEMRLAPAMAQALVELGATHAMVVHSEDGMDEISAWAPTRIFEVRAGRVTEGLIRPADFGIRIAPPAHVRIENADHAVEVMRAALGGDSGAAQEVLSLNGGAAIYVGGRAASLAEGVESARLVLRQGLALKTLERMRAASREED
ncbi:MAG: anthranilate phosphoribosyltransferase [Candidatus Binataceae bacterium]